jgi:hypothetical protein
MFKRNKSFFIRFGLLLLVSFLISGCLFFTHGSLYVTSNPSGAAIYLNGTYSGKVTPSLISHLSPGSYLLGLTLEELSKSREESVIIFQNQLTSIHIDLLAQLDYLEVLPHSITLYPGESQAISSITVYFQDSSQEEIPADWCEYLSSSSNVDVNTNGMITALSPGTTQVTVYYSAGDVTVSDTIQVNVIPVIDYRALCIGVDEYLDPLIQDLRAPSFDVERMHQVFENSRFGDNQFIFTTINSLIGEQATRSNIMNSIASSFSGVDNNDISYFYFSGHGYSDGETSTILPYDALAENASKDITVDELALALRNIPGTKVVILDSCHSGGFIGKELFSRGIPGNDNLRQFNENILESFALHDTLLAKGNLASGEFKVIVSASGDQQCWETLNHPIDDNPFAYFSASLCGGCGYNNFNFPAPADRNMDSRITLNEIYLYIDTSLSHLEQDVQVYPQNSSFIFIEY